MSNFAELKDKVNEWCADEEDILLRKLKDFTDNYAKKCEELGNNLENINKYVSLVNLDYFNSLNTLKNVSIKKFVEHIVDNHSATSSARDMNENSNKNYQGPSRTSPIILSKEEREANLLAKFKSAISKSLENLNIKTMLDIRVDQEKESVIDDDNVSVSSSRYFASNMNKGYKNMKLPFIIGTQEFFKHEYLGVYQGDSLVSDNPSNIGNNNENVNYERRATTVEINVDELNLVSKLSDGNIDMNNRNIPSIPNVPSIPAVPGGKSNIPPIPNGKIPIPPVINLAVPNSNNINNIPSNQNVPNIPNIPTVPTIPNVSNQKVNEINNISNTEIKKDENPVSFKDTLNKMFTNNNVSRTSNVNTNMNNIPAQTSFNLQPDYNSDNIIPDPKQTKIENVIKRPTIFDNVIDDDDDDNELFRRGIDRRHFTKSNLFENVVPQQNNIKSEQIANTNIVTNNNTQTYLPQYNQRETLQSYVRESNFTTYTQLNPNNTNANIHGSSANLNNLIENKNKNLEKAKSNLLKIFDDDEDEDKDKNVLVSTKINEKTFDLNNKVNLLLDPKKEIPINKKEETNINTKNKPYQNLVQNINIGVKTDFNTLPATTNQSNLNSSVAGLKQPIKRPIFLEDDEEDSNILKPVKKEEKTAEKQISNKNVMKADPLSNINYNLSVFKATEKKEDKEIKSSIPPNEIADSLKEVDFGLKYMKEDKKLPAIASDIIDKNYNEKEKYLYDKNGLFQKQKISFVESDEDKWNKSKEKLRESLPSNDTKNLTKPIFDFEEKAEPFKSKQKEDKIVENQKSNFPSSKPIIPNIKTEESNAWNINEKINNDEKNQINFKKNELEQEKPATKKLEGGIREISDVSVKNNEIKISNRFSDIQNMIGGKLNFNSMMRSSAVEESSKISTETLSNKISTGENEDNNYEKIVSEKTAVINKKKPKMRMFNSNMNMDSDMNKKSISNENIQQVEEKKEIEKFPFEKLEEEIVVQKIENEKIDELNNFMNTIVNKPEEIIKPVADNTIPKKKFEFTSITEKEDDNLTNKKLNLSTQNNNNIESIAAKKPSVLFDFDDSAVTETKNTSLYNKNKLQENANSASKKPVDKKIKFLFEDE